MNKYQQYFFDRGLDLFHLFDCQNLEEKYQNHFMGYKSGILLGNTKHLWPLFIRSLGEGELARENPLDEYIEKICKGFCESKKIELIFTHQKLANDTFFPFQKFAYSIGQSKLMKTNLLFHPEFGYWFSLRALLLFSDENVASVLKEGNEKPPSCSYDCVNLCEKEYMTYEQSKSNKDHMRFRKACPHASDYQFSDQQLRYHYFNDKEVLRQEIRRVNERF